MESDKKMSVKEVRYFIWVRYGKEEPILYSATNISKSKLKGFISFKKIYETSGEEAKLLTHVPIKNIDYIEEDVRE